MNPIEFFKRWGKGILELPPIELIKAQMVAQMGSIFGLIFATVFLCLMGFSYLIIVMIFTIILNILSYIEAHQKYNGLKALIISKRESEKNEQELFNDTSGNQEYV